MTSTTEHRPYTHIAPLYDDIMRDVDYEEWADYIDEIIQYHHPDAEDILELGCGTGTHALKLDELECYRILATDIAPEMVDIARKKAVAEGAKLEFGVADFLSFQLDRTFDAVFLVFDSLNYIEDASRLSGLFQSVEAHLNPGGIFIFDFTTPGFSGKIEETLNEPERRIGNTRYRRKSHWNPEFQIHTNHFIIEQLDPQTDAVLEHHEETHRQKIHSQKIIEQMVGHSGLTIEARYADFDFSEIDDNTDRITMVLRNG